jgi:alcohol dehydrogenase class IV
MAHYPPVPAFTLGRLPRITFGDGRFDDVPGILARHGRRILLVTGARSFRAGGAHARLTDVLDRAGLELCGELAIEDEPSPALVDEAVGTWRGAGIEVVLACGGGSVIDAGKAIAGLLRTGASVLDHLEVVGRGIPYRGPALPVVAVPTTAGTGSEATRNAVLSLRGQGGFKRSFRDERLVPADALVDPALLEGAPRNVIAANGADALTQLLEAYVSTGASPVTDALALDGLRAARDGLLTWHRDPEGPRARGARSEMAYAALLSGVCLANAGLGAVHGLASPLGALLPIPHGEACGALLAPVVAANIRALEDRASGSPTLERFADVGRVLAGQASSLPDDKARRALVTVLTDWTRELGIRGLGAWGLTAADVGWLVAEGRSGSMRTNPVELADDELASILHAAM